MIETMDGQVEFFANLFRSVSHLPHIRFSFLSGEVFHFALVLLSPSNLLPNSTLVCTCTPNHFPSLQCKMCCSQAFGKNL